MLSMCVCMHSRFVKNYLIRILEDGPLISEVVLSQDDLSFYRYNHLKSFVCCVWNIEHLSNVFC
jgi:hypothetical protein